MNPLTASNRRFVLVAIVAFAGFFAVDSYLFANGGFLRRYGRATQEGQVQSKVERAPRQAELADVILFGSSYVRSGMAGEPFLERGLLPFNFAVSGGAQVYDFFALKRIAPVLAARTDRPTLVIEIKPDVLPRTRNSAWSEYPQYISIVRSRGEMLRHAPALWRNFREFRLTSQFLSGILIPSSIYRAHAVQLLGARGSLEGQFYGAEDFSGFSPLYTRAVPSMVPDVKPLPAVPVSELWPGKVEFLRQFLALARATGCPVVLYETPSVLMGRDSAVLDSLVEAMQHEFPGVGIIRTGDYHLEIGDFDEGGHPNISGSDKMGRYLIERLGLQGSAPRLADKIRRGFAAAEVPAPTAWTRDAARTTATVDELVVAGATAPSALLFESPPIAVGAGREWTLEMATPGLIGRVIITLSWVDPSSGVEKTASAVTPVGADQFGSSARVFIRAVPTAGQVVVRVQDFDAQAPAAGRFKVLRLWSNQ